MNSTFSNSQGAGDHNNNPTTTTTTDLLPTYEETLESAVRKKYTLKYPQLISRTVHASDSETGELAVQKKVKGLLGTKLEFRGNASDQLLWSCRRERQGFELVFSRKVDSLSPLSPPPPLPPVTPLEDAPPFSAPSDEEEEEQPSVVSDCLLRDQADNKPADDDREYIHRENDQPPPAYEESALNANQEIRLTSSYPFPFRYDFEFPLASSSSNSPVAEEREEGEGLAQTKLRWLRNQEAKNPSAVSESNPWTAFSCVERPSGRMLAEVVHYSTNESALGTLVIHGELDPDLHTFLVVSAIPVIEEYPVRHLEHIDRK
ncbi:hypothetical protein LPJ59_003429 [Coemansia sp. RSA 2399]|nr:hypothetical protein LPJ59_003429 [Coemansia sp. RSA 2399]KAJ1903410.1 hypothetical protein LPJ81_003074 [Coemansia sp. IMI 209127]